MEHPDLSKMSQHEIIDYRRDLMMEQEKLEHVYTGRQLQIGRIELAITRLEIKKKLLKNANTEDRQGLNDYRRMLEITKSKEIQSYRS